MPSAPCSRGFAGSFFATKQRFISPESFTFIESAIILAIVVLGGMGSQIGVVIAAVLLIGLPEWFRELGNYRMLAFGIAMVLIMVLRPRGLIGHREPSIRLHPRGLRWQRMNGAGPLIEVEHLTMRFGGLIAVDDVSFIGRPQEITAIIGPNGAGKTTVFNCITGFYKPTSRAVCPACTRRDRDYLLERMARPRDRPARAGRPHVPEHPPVSRHDGAGEPDRRAAQQADARPPARACSGCSG